MNHIIYRFSQKSAIDFIKFKFFKDSLRWEVIAMLCIEKKLKFYLCDLKLGDYILLEKKCYFTWRLAISQIIVCKKNSVILLFQF